MAGHLDQFNNTINPRFKLTTVRRLNPPKSDKTTNPKLMPIVS
ncbi:MAG: hypothetical protein ACJAXK_001369 [Yoonia sp.]|jgi:hypothetical protein